MVSDVSGGVAIETFDLTKRFNGFTAVDHVNIRVKEGEIFGLLGPNGAGKTTLVRMLSTLTRPTEGTAKIMGFAILHDTFSIRKIIGIVSEKILLYPELTPAENLRFFGRLYGLSRNKLEEKIDELLDMVKLSNWKNTPVGAFSSGMRQRLNVVRALLSEPKVLFLDEPTVALDPQSTAFIRSLILELSRQGKTIVLTTHIMDEADRLCQRVGIMDHGKILAVGSPEELKQQHSVNTLEEVFLSLTGRELRDFVDNKVSIRRTGRLSR